jgi:uncharacterized membrane protein
MKVSIEHTRVAINIMRARLTILGFNLAIITFQISNTRGLGGGTRLEGFETTVHLSTGTVLLIGLALTIASMVVFIASSAFDREGTCDSRILLAGDLLMYLALAQTVSGFFSSYGRVLEVLLIPTEAEQGALSTIQIGIAIVGSTVWALVIYVGPIVSLARSSHTRVTKLLHTTGYFGILIFISHLWWAAQRIEGRAIASDGSQSAWFNAFAAPLYW